MEFKTDLNQKEDKSFSLKVTIPNEEVNKTYQEVVEEEAKTAEIKGFRKGKAPAEVVEKKIGKEKLNNRLLEKVIRKVYPEAVKKEDLKPIVPPQVNLISTAEGEDWEVEFTSAQLPEIKLKEVREKIKEANATSKIWTPGKEGETENEQENKDKQIQKIIDVILKNAELNLPDVLIEQELNRKIVNLVDQINQAGLELEKYLSTKGTTIDKLKEQYRQEIINNWKIDLALEKIADEENIEVTKEDTEKIEKSKTNPYIAAKILRRQKTLEYLLGL